MGKPLHNESVGKAVYKAYSPVQAGKIVAIVHPRSEPVRMPDGTSRTRYFATVRVKWTNGTETDVETSGLQDLEALVEDHRKKLATHEATLAKVKLIGT